MFVFFALFTTTAEHTSRNDAASHYASLRSTGFFVKSTALDAD